MIIRDDNVVLTPVHPVPPAVPKRSHPAGKVVIDTASSDRGSLLHAVNSIVEAGLKELSMHGNEYDTKLQKLEIYKSAFQHLINEFNLYRPFLSAVKNEYDSVIERLSEDIRSVSALRVETVMKEQDHAVKMKSKEQAFRTEISAKNSQILALERELKKRDEDLAAWKEKFENNEAKHLRINTEVIELRNSCQILTNSLTRAEDEKRLLISTEMGTKVEMQNAKNSLAKANEEVERFE